MAVTERVPIGSAARGQQRSRVRGRMARLMRLSRRNPMGVFGGLFIFIIVVIALAAPLLATHDPFELSASDRLQSPSASHYFGTDDLGRDLYSRMLYGARISLWVGLLAVAISVGVGAPAGLISAYMGGIVDEVLQRINDALFAFPVIVLGLSIVAVLGSGVTQVIIAVGIVNIAPVARVVRSQALSVKAQPYVEAAASLGASNTRIIARHLVPNVLAPIWVMATAGFSTAILAEAALSFLGVGTPPPEPSWGTMLSGAAQNFVRVAPWMAIFPGLGITFAVLAFNTFGDALRDVFDPRLRGSM